MNIAIRMVTGSAWLAVAGAASAGVYLETTYSRPGEGSGAEVQRMWFDGGRFRSEQDGGAQAQIFRDQTLYALDPAKKQYMKVDRKMLDTAGSKLAEARKLMDSQLGNLSPEQRRAMEQAMGKIPGLGAAAAAPPVRTVRATSRTESAAGRDCKVWEVLEDGSKVEEVCAAPVASLDGGGEVLATMKEVIAMTESFTRSIGADTMRGAAAWTELDKIDGIPVIARTFENGALASETTLTAFRKESPPAGAFEVPDDYSEQRLGL